MKTRGCKEELNHPSNNSLAGGLGIKRLPNELHLGESKHREGNSSEYLRGAYTLGHVVLRFAGVSLWGLVILSVHLL